MNLWNSMPILEMSVDNAEHRRTQLPIIFKALHQVHSSHWHEGVKGLATSILTLYMESDPALYEQCMATAMM